MLHEYIWKGLLTVSLSSKAMNDIRSLGKAWSPDKSYDKLVIQNINKLSNWERYYTIDFSSALVTHCKRASAGLEVSPGSRLI